MLVKCSIDSYCLAVLREYATGFSIQTPITYIIIYNII